MCLACEEEAFYRAYLDHLAKKAKEEAAKAADSELLCDEAAERAGRELNKEQ
jgi:hypothetical protein